MTMPRPVRLALLACCVSLAAAVLHGQALPAQKPFEPTVGQAGKDVVWVPTCQVLVDKMLDMAKVTADDYVIDLGSGDGRTVMTAAKRGATLGMTLGVMIGVGITVTFVASIIRLFSRRG